MTAALISAGAAILVCLINNFYMDRRREAKAETDFEVLCGEYLEPLLGEYLRGNPDGAAIMEKLEAEYEQVNPTNPAKGSGDSGTDTAGQA